MPALDAILPEYRRLIKLDSTSMSHVKAFTKVLKVAIDVNAAEFKKADVLNLVSNRTCSYYCSTRSTKGKRVKIDHADRYLEKRLE